MLETLPMPLDHVSGRTKTSACRHSSSIRITVSQKIRSPSLMFGLFTLRL